MRRLTRSTNIAWSLIGTLALTLVAAAGCTPRLVAKPPASVLWVPGGPGVRVLPVEDRRANPLLVSTGYVGLFQVRYDISTGPDTPPASVLSDAFARELHSRGVDSGGDGAVDVGCRVEQFLIRYRNYAGAYSPTDGWGYLDLACRATVAGQVVWEGRLHARHHRVQYLLWGFTVQSSVGKTIWPEMTGALVQQVVAMLNRRLFHRAATTDFLRAAVEDLGSNQTDTREAAAYRLGVTGDPAAIAPLMARFDDADQDVRRAVVDALGTLGAREVLPALLARFDAEDGNVQWAIIKDVLQMEAPEGYDFLRSRSEQIASHDTLKDILMDVLDHPPPAFTPPLPAIPAAL